MATFVYYLQESYSSCKTLEGHKRKSPSFKRKISIESLRARVASRISRRYKSRPPERPSEASETIPSLEIEKRRMFSFLARYKDDIVYLSLLLASIACGPWYRRLQTPAAKKWIGTLLGLFLVVVVSGHNALHALLSVVLGITTIKLCPMSYIHGATFFVMFAYLFFFRLADHFGLPLPTGQTNLIEMILVLRVVGVAFEINGSWVWLGRAKKTEKSEERTKDDDFVEIINPSTMDLFHYSFNYVGLLTGPYYRYRTFDDFLHLPFSQYADGSTAALGSLGYVPVFVSLYLAISYLWPVDYVLTDEFRARNWIYKAMYPWALFGQFRQRIYAGMTLAECVCSSAGLGAYPVQGKNRTGHGPTVGYLKIKNMSDEDAKMAQYDFNTVVSVDVWGCETIITFRDSMKVWNKAVQYWVGMYIHKRFPIKFLKLHVALFVSVIWHGFHAGYFFCIYFCPFYVMAEDIYVKLYYNNATGIKRKIWSFVLWFLRGHYESYQTAAFLLLSFDRVWIFYSSMYHYPYILWLVVFILGLILKFTHKS